MPYSIQRIFLIGLSTLGLSISMWACGGGESKKPLGESCQIATDCISGNCGSNGRCVERGNNNNNNNNGNLCAPGSTQTCVCPNGNGAQTCNQDGQGWGTCQCSGGNNNNNNVCTPGSTQACACSDGKKGSQTCNQDGKGWGICQCSGGNNNVCTPGATQTCTCSDGKSGAQTCNQDGKGWGICQCSGGNNNVCTPGATQVCTCNDGNNGSQTCNQDGKGWGVCQCSGGNNGKPLGSPCRQASECSSGKCIPGADGTNFCSEGCSGSKKCPTGFACVLNQGAQSCYKSGPGAFGASCTRGSNCQSGICLQNGTCTRRCDNDPTPCPSGMSCNAVATDLKVCSGQQNTNSVCSSVEVGNANNCLKGCNDQDNACQNACFLKHLSEPCQKCYSELGSCAVQNNCNPATDNTCCATKRKECFGN